MDRSGAACKEGHSGEATNSRTSSASTSAPSDSTPMDDFEWVSFTSPWPVGWQPLHTFFNQGDVQRWESGRFRMERVLQSAPRNKGRVDHMFDASTGMHVAVKHIPNSWVCESHDVFAARHPRETERPWVDIGCAALLTSLDFPYACPLLGVYQGRKTTHVVMELAQEGDLFDWAVACPEAPGKAREALVQPLARQILDAVRQLHELSIVHRDISAENIVLSRPDGGALQIQLIDFGMSTKKRYMRGGGGHGKPAYQAPETHWGDAYDGFLSDAFAVGVLLFSILTGENPWVSTEPGRCKAFEFCKTHGFRAFAARRKCFKQTRTVAECLSEPAMQVLDGLLCSDPVRRLTLGESGHGRYGDGWARPSVWDQAWVQG